MNYEFHPMAEFEYLEAVAFYEFKRPGIGFALLEEFARAMDNVVARPTLYPVELEPDIRRVVMKRFPYSIIYREIPEVVQVLAFAHQRRRPMYWLDRL